MDEARENNGSGRFERANTLTEVRAELLIESTRSLLLVNGGGAVAVATWLQAVWSQPWAAAILRIQVIGGGILLLGAFFACICPFLRYLTYWHPNAAKPFENPLWKLYAAVTAASAGAFLLGMLFVFCGFMRALP